MAAEEQLHRGDFDLLTKLHGIAGEPAYLDELYAQARGVYIMAETVKKIGVSGVEPQKAFIPPTD